VEKDNQSSSTSTPNGRRSIELTVNLPAFELTLLQDGRSVTVYKIGIGRKRFTTIIGDRQAYGIIWNPEWIPPDSPWVGEMSNVEPGERIKSGDPRNPLGKLKIPLGGAYLIHEADKSSDVGHLVSHGCIRMRRSDLFDLTDRIMDARQWPISKERIERAKRTYERVPFKFVPTIPVRIKYDTIGVENGMLIIYRDVYRLGTNTHRALRNKLLDAGMDTSLLEEGLLRRILLRARKAKVFTTKLSELRLYERSPL